MSGEQTKMSKLAILLIGFTALAAAATHDYTVRSDRWKNVIFSSSFSFWRGNQTWNLSSANGTDIELRCPTFFLTYDWQRKVPISTLTIDDGFTNKTFQGEHSYFKYISQSSNVTIKLETTNAETGGYLLCRAIAIEPGTVESGEQ